MPATSGPGEKAPEKLKARRAGWEDPEPGEGSRTASEPNSRPRTAGLRLSFQLTGKAQNSSTGPVRIFWSRRRESTPVNSACQERTTTSGILDDFRGIKVRNSSDSAVENGWKPHGQRVSWPGGGCGCVTEVIGLAGFPGHFAGCLASVPRLRVWGAGHKSRKVCSFGGRVWRMWRTGTEERAPKGARGLED
jgi:hypothetical protein